MGVQLESCRTARPPATATGFADVYVYATQGGSDTATLDGSEQRRIGFYSYPDYSLLTDSNRSFYFYAQRIRFRYGQLGQHGYTYAYFYDSPGVDAFEATPASATMNRADSWSDATATGFKRVYAYSTRGGNDTAVLTGAATAATAIGDIPPTPR